MENELKKRVKDLIDEINSTHRYSMSRITDLHNEVFSLTEKPEPSVSILLRKKKDLEKWIES